MKNKKFLLSFIAVSMAAASLSAFAIVNSKKAEIFNSMKQAVADHEFDVDMTTIQSTGDEGVYQAVAVGSGENTVTAKLVGVTPTVGGFTVAANSIAYITNVDSIRGIASLKLNYSGGSPIILCYGSSNLLNVDDIFGGKYQDLAVTQRNSWEEGFNFTLGPSQNENLFANCHYVLGFIYNTGDTALTFDKVNFTAVCGEEPATKPVGTYSDFTANEQARFTTLGVKDMPFPGCGSYYLESGASDYLIFMNSLIPESRFGSMGNGLMSKGYNLAFGPEYIASQKYTGLILQKVVGENVDTYMITYTDACGGYVYCQFGYSNTTAEIKQATEWPTDDINAIYSGMGNYYEPLNLSNATYNIVHNESNGGKRSIYIYISISGSLATAQSEIATYLAGLDSSTYTVDGNKIYRNDGLHTMNIEIEESSSTVMVSLQESVVFDNFPFDTITEYNSLPLFPEESSVDPIPGSYYFSSSSEIIADQFDATDFALLKAILENHGYYHIGNSTTGGFYPILSSETEYYGILHYYKDSASMYTFRYNSCRLENDYEEFNNLQHTYFETYPDTEASDSFIDTVNYDGKFELRTMDRQKVITLVGGTLADMDDIYDAVDDDKVAYKQKFPSLNSFSFAVRVGGWEPEEYVNFDLFFTETSVGLDIEIVDTHYTTGSPTFDHDSVGVYASNEHALDEIDTAQYGTPIALPAGDNYIVGPINSVDYVSTTIDVRRVTNAYAQSLLSNGYTYNIVDEMFVSSSTSRPNVKFRDNQRTGRLSIEFTDEAPTRTLVSYDNLSSSVKTFLSNFPTIQEEGNNYYAMLGGDSLSLMVDDLAVVPGSYKTKLKNVGFVTSNKSEDVYSSYSTMCKLDESYNYYQVYINYNYSQIFSWEHDKTIISFQYEAEKFKPVDSTEFDDAFYDYVVLPENGRIAINGGKSEKTDSFHYCGDINAYEAYLVSLGFVKEYGRYTKQVMIDECNRTIRVDITNRSLYSTVYFYLN